jgi:hypothetical protein
MSYASMPYVDYKRNIKCYVVLVSFSQDNWLRNKIVYYGLIADCCYIKNECCQMETEPEA